MDLRLIKGIIQGGIGKPIIFAVGTFPDFGIDPKKETGYWKRMHNLPLVNGCVTSVLLRVLLAFVE